HSGPDAHVGDADPAVRFDALRLRRRAVAALRRRWRPAGPPWSPDGHGPERTRRPAPAARPGRDGVGVRHWILRCPDPRRRTRRGGGTNAPGTGLHGGLGRLLRARALPPPHARGATAARPRADPRGPSAVAP